MEECKNKTGWDTVKCVWREYASLYIVPPMITGIFIGFAIGFSINDLSGLVESLLPEFVGIGITITGIYYLEQWRQGKVDEKRLKKELLWQVTSQSQDVAVSAIDRIRYEGWLSGDDGILKGIFAPQAKWSGANLSVANLEGAVLNFANLDEANLMGANLSKAKLSKANLQYSKLNKADFTEADLYEANLNHANLDMTNFERAVLWHAVITNIATSSVVISYVNFHRAMLHEADFENSNMREWVFQESSVWGANFKNVSIQACNFKDVKDISQARFDSTEFRPHPLTSTRYWIDDHFEWQPYIDGYIYEKYPEDWQIRVKLIENPYIS